MTHIERVYESERLGIYATIHDTGEVRFSLVARKTWESSGKDLWYMVKYNAECTGTSGWINPVNRWGCRQLSVSEAFHEMMDYLHRVEFRMREAEAQIEASREAIRALAKVEELLA